MPRQSSWSYSSSGSPPGSHAARALALVGGPTGAEQYAAGGGGLNGQLAAELGAVGSLAGVPGLPPPSVEEGLLDRALSAVHGAHGAHDAPIASNERARLRQFAKQRARRQATNALTQRRAFGFEIQRPQ